MSTATPLVAGSSSSSGGSGGGGATLNINVGVLGHVDSGKTSLVRALSTHLSTAALDKHPQSVERGITLDLGFSSFTTDVPPHLAAHGWGALQVTLVDCPGHASLIKTIIGGAQIIDLMILVIDVTKGIQTQTAECLIIGEITSEKLIVVLNKVDLIPADSRAKEVERMSARIRKVLASTKFGAAPFVVLSAAPGGGGKMGAAAPLLPAPTSGSASSGSGSAGSKAQSETVADLVRVLKENISLPVRSREGPFHFAIDHCFPIKGQGTVLTGTVLCGSAKVNDMLELPEIGQTKKIKSIQMFHKPAAAISQGDRAGLCVAGLDASLIERGIGCTPGSVPTLPAVIALVKKIRFFKGLGASSSRFHVTVGHTTVMATVVFFGAHELARQLAARDSAAAAEVAAAAAADAEAAAIVDADSASAASSLETLPASLAAALPSRSSARVGGASAGAGAGVASGAGGKLTAVASSAPSTASASVPEAAIHRTSEMLALEAATLKRTAARGIPALPYDWSAEYAWQDELAGGAGGARPRPAAATATSAATSAPLAAPAAAAAEEGGSSVEWQWAALLFDAPVLCPLGSLVLGSRLDTDLHANACRIAFHGRIVEPLPSADIHSLARAHIYKRKEKVGAVDRVESTDAGVVSFIGKNLFKKETDMSKFVGLTVHTRLGQVGRIDSSFGKSGKFKVSMSLSRFDLLALERSLLTEPLLLDSAPPPLVAAYRAYQRDGGAGGTIVTLAGCAPPVKPRDALYLRFKKYQFAGKTASSSSIVQ